MYFPSTSSMIVDVTIYVDFWMECEKLLKDKSVESMMLVSIIFPKYIRIEAHDDK